MFSSNKKYRIFLILGESVTSNYSGSKIWTRNIYETFLKLGHDVVYLNIDNIQVKQKLNTRKKVKEYLSNNLLSIFLKEHTIKKFDFVFSYLWDSLIYPEALANLREHIFLINFTTNYHQFNLYKEISNNVDLSIYITKIAKKGFDDLGVKSYWMPLAANHNFYKSETKIEYQYNASFVGTPYGNRPYYLWRLLQHGVGVDLFGGKWTLNNNLKEKLKEVRNYYRFLKSNNLNRVNIIEDIERNQIIKLINSNFRKSLHNPPTDEQYVDILAKSKININTSESRYNHDFSNPNVLLGANLRDFEITVTGGFLLTHYSDEIEEFFEIDKEIVTWKNEIELIDKVKFYLKNENEREKIRKAGHKKALAVHTWEKRFTEFFNYLGREL